MEKNTDHLWIFSSRPKSIDEMLLTDEMEKIINSDIKKTELKNDLVKIADSLRFHKITKKISKPVYCIDKTLITAKQKRQLKIKSEIVDLFTKGMEFYQL